MSISSLLLFYLFDSGVAATNRCLSLRRFKPKYLRWDKASRSPTATEVTKEVTTKTQANAPDAGSTVQRKKHVWINPEATTVLLGHIYKSGAEEGAASALGSPPQRAGQKLRPDKPSLRVHHQRLLRWWIPAQKAARRNTAQSCCFKNIHPSSYMSSLGLA